MFALDRAFLFLFVLFHLFPGAGYNGSGLTFHEFIVPDIPPGDMTGANPPS